ncbi:MAG TPA: efflux RND transporter periplasmic adaptor subunit [Spirochaetia bacterium]|nr:efflux RND transporter periplasmic adaptor subunit [Spirochaetia bacterium]
MQTPGNRRSVPILLVVVASILLLATFTSCARPKTAAAPGAANAADAPTIFPISVTEAVAGDLSDYITVAGGIEAAKSVDVYADTSGTLVSLKVRLGDYVQRDQIVAEVDPSRPGQNFVANPVRAPIAGTITLLPVDLGSRITQAVPVVRISTIDHLQLKTQIAERFIGQIRDGERAIVSLEPYPEATFAAHVTELSPIVDAQTRTMGLTLEFDTPDPRVKAGMYAEIKIITQHRTSIVKVPTDTIIERGPQLFVFVPETDNTAKKRDVKVGIQIDGKSEIVSGLRAGERVVARGQSLLEDGARIRIMDQLPPLPAEDVVR